jgi:hypothetical protein
MKQIYKIMLVILILSTQAQASTTRIQIIHISKGWNAVFIEVKPVNPAPDSVFQETPVDQVFTYYPKKSSIQYIQEPDEIDIKNDGWSRWVPPENNDSFLNSIFQILPGHAYLIHSKENFTWKLTGNAYFKQKAWQPDSFNLTGFYVNPDDPPTFASFFQHSEAHKPIIVYNLVNDLWQQIKDPETVLIESGKAYWIYSKGGSDYHSPTRITLPLNADGLSFGIEKTTSKIHLVNKTDLPLDITIQQMEGSQTDNCPVFIDKTLYQGKRIYEPLGTMRKTIESESTMAISLMIREGEISESFCGKVLQINDNQGSLFYIPISVQQ